MPDSLKATVAIAGDEQTGLVYEVRNDHFQNPFQAANVSFNVLDIPQHDEPGLIGTSGIIIKLLEISCGAHAKCQMKIYSSQMRFKK